MKISLLAVALLISVASFGQKTIPLPSTIPTPGAFTGQLLNLSNTYPSATNDTATNTTALYLTVAAWNTTTLLPYIYPLFGSGTITFVVNGVKISGTPAGSITLEESTDGTHWAQSRVSIDPVISSTRTVSALDSNTATYTMLYADMYTILNVSTTQAFSINLPSKPVPYYRIKILGVGTQTSSWKAWYFFTLKS